MKIIILILVFMLNISACSSQEEIPPPVAKPDTPENPNEPNPSENTTMRITINNTLFTATLEDNATAKAFKARLPMTIKMSEMNGNEKFYNLSHSLPTIATHSGVIQNGDIMLFGSTTLVLFYQTFSTSYSYTKIGTVDNSSELSSVLGSGNVLITFEDGYF